MQVQGVVRRRENYWSVTLFLVNGQDEPKKLRKELGETKTGDFEKKLRPLLTAYDAWITDREADLKSPEMKQHKDAGKVELERCRTALVRIEAGLKLISTDEKAAEAFRFANLAMWQQRVRSIYSLKRRRDEPADFKEIDLPRNRSWYPFQLAFVLLNLPGITEFGVGAIVELPNLSVMVMGLDDWPVEQGSSEINEPRLLRAVQGELGTQVVKLLTPPVTPESTGYQANPFDDTANVGVPVAPFPRWLLCPYCRLLAPIQSGLFELKLDPYRKDRSRYVHRNCKKPGKPPTVLPARFLAACENGHLDDFPWVEYVHKGRTDCKYELRLYELGASGEVADIQLQCVKCDKKRRLSDAFGTEGHTQLPQCRARWPHLRKFDEKGCNSPQRGILLGASNSWFPVMLTALSIPTMTNKLGQLIEQNWAELEECESAREVKLKRKLLRGLSVYSDDQIWEEVEKKKSGTKEDEEEASDLREPEWKIFSNPDPKLNSRDFKLKVVEPPNGYRQILRKVVLAERLREVRSLIGFTRIESPGDYSEVSELPDEKRAPLSRKDPRWVPTSDVRGEGIFLHFHEEAVQAWMKKVKGLDAIEAGKLARSLPTSLIHTIARIVSDFDRENWPASRARVMQNIAHPLYRTLAAHFLDCWQNQAGEMSSQAVCAALMTAAESEKVHRDHQSIELVWTGPDAGVVPLRRTEQALLQVIESATQKITIVSYAVYNIDRVSKALIDAANRGVKSAVIIETPDRNEGQNNYNTLKALGPSVASQCDVYLWPIENRTRDVSGKPGILHVKCAVADSRTLFISSANLTEYAFTVNMELGLLITGGAQPVQVENQFDRMIQNRILVKL